MDMETILSRVQALLNKTVEKGCTPEEAAAAAALAQNLLFKHNLTIAQAKDHRKADREAIQNHTKKVRGAKVSFRWRQSLAATIARYNWCSVIVDPRGLYIWIIGKPSNAAVVEYLSEVVGDQIHKLGQKACDSRSFYMSFCRGAIATIDRRLREQQEANIHAAAGSTALVVQSEKELEEAVNNFFPKLKDARATRVTNYAGYLAGKKAGESISMNKGVGSSAPKKFIQ